MAREIPLTQGKVAIVDDKDYDLVKDYKWRLHTGGYARTTVYGEEGVERKDIYMHRLVLSAKNGTLVDHVNGDKLDNRRENLRAATTSQNSANSPRKRCNTSGYKGVTFHAHTGKWRAQIMHNRKYLHIGLYKTREDAAHAYDKKARELYGEFAQVNFYEMKEGSVSHI